MAVAGFRPEQLSVTFEPGMLVVRGTAEEELATAFIDFAVKDSNHKIRVFTTRIDTIYGATAVVLSAEHPLLPELLKDSALKNDVEAFAEKVKNQKAIRTDLAEEGEKEGLNTGVLAVNPFSGETLPVWVANYVLMEYGTGAVMSVPGHDERDFEFAQKYSLPIRQVIAPVTHNQITAEPMPTTAGDASADAVCVAADFPAGSAFAVSASFGVSFKSSTNSRTSR